jgi:hypothetical protein
MLNELYDCRFVSQTIELVWRNAQYILAGRQGKFRLPGAYHLATANALPRRNEKVYGVKPASHLI